MCVGRKWGKKKQESQILNPERGVPLCLLALNHIGMIQLFCGDERGRLRIVFPFRRIFWGTFQVTKSIKHSHCWQVVLIWGSGFKGNFDQVIFSKNIALGAVRFSVFCSSGKRASEKFVSRFLSARKEIEPLKEWGLSHFGCRLEGRGGNRDCSCNIVKKEKISTVNLKHGGSHFQIEFRKCKGCA